MRKRAFLLAVLIFAAALLPVTMQARVNDLISLPTGTSARVVEIIDVNAIRVRTPAGDALVRLIGVHGSGAPEAISHLSREIMGTYVTLARDAGFPDSGRWNYMYVVLGNRFINGELVLSGYGRLNEGHRRAAQFAQISTGQGVAMDTGLGMWAGELREPIITYFGVRINMNTATPEQIVQHLNHLGADLAQARHTANAIQTFRGQGVFQHVSDVAFVPAVSRQFFAQNRNMMSVSTNINAATVEEINSLIGVSTADAQRIVQSRSNQRFTDLEQLFTRGLMTRLQLNSNMPFIALETVDRIDFARPNFGANLNLATHAQLVRAGASTAQANAIVAQREAMPLRNLQDLRDFTWLFSMNQVNALADNMRTHTNINTATLSEIESLFGSHDRMMEASSIIVNRPYTDISQISQFMTPAEFNRMAPYIYVGQRPEQNLINMNTASYQQLIDHGFPSDVAARLTAPARPPLLRPSQLPAWIAPELRQNSTLFTNINTATAQELLSLDRDMTQDLVNRIISERNHQPFSSDIDVREFFVEMDRAAMIQRFERFIIVR